MFLEFFSGTFEISLWLIKYTTFWCIYTGHDGLPGKSSSAWRWVLWHIYQSKQPFYACTKNCLYIYNSDLRQIFYDYLSEMLYLYQEKSSVRIDLEYTLLFLARQCIGGLNSDRRRVGGLHSCILMDVSFCTVHSISRVRNDELSWWRTQDYTWFCLHCKSYSNSNFQEKTAVLQSFKERAKLVAETFNSMEGIQCNEVMGAMYAFPQVFIPKRAQEEAKVRDSWCSCEVLHWLCFQYRDVAGMKIFKDKDKWKRPIKKFLHVRHLKSRILCW